MPQSAVKADHLEVLLGRDANSIRKSILHSHMPTVSFPSAALKRPRGHIDKFRYLRPNDIFELGVSPLVFTKEMETL